MVKSKTNTPNPNLFVFFSLGVFDNYIHVPLLRLKVIYRNYCWWTINDYVDNVCSFIFF